MSDDPRITRLIPGKRYLGDGVYVKASGWGTCIDLTAENGIEIIHRIVLEPEIMRALQQFMDELTTGVTQLLKEREADKADVAAPAADAQTEEPPSS